MNVSADGLNASAPVIVGNAKIDRPISFKLDVMPVFTRAGCNAGSCHGAARGKDGFRLSLYGFDPDGDYYRLTHEQVNRRINLAVPQDSLMIQKAQGKVPHTGGKRFGEDSELCQTLLRWLEVGAPRDAANVATPTALELEPANSVLDGAGAQQQLVAKALYSDGTSRDVTNLAVFISSNDNSATVTPDGLVTAAQRGEAFVTARFATFTVGAGFIVIPKGDAFTVPKVPEFNYIDELVDAKLWKLHIAPSELCSDEEFLRRAYIDIIGLLPSPADRIRFLNDPGSKKREKLVDELLARREFVDLWVMKWAELLKIRSSDGQRVSYKATLLYFNWLEQQIQNNVPFDQIVRQLIWADGGTFKNPAANYYQLESDPLKLAEDTAQVFMGMRIQCAQCHNHPFDRWTLDDYYGFAGFFSQVARKPGEDPRETIVSNSGGGEVKHPLGDKVVPVKFLGGALADVKSKDRRQVLADWLASPANPYFARNLANIVWAHFLGRGIIEPVDDVRVSNPPSNPQLIDELARRFQEYHYDFKRLVRDICTSRTYQLSSRTNVTNQLDDRNFSHAAVRRIRAEVLLDCIDQVTQTQEKFKSLPRGSRAVEIADGATSNFFLTIFGRASRETVCSCEVKMEPNLSQALHLLNGNTVHQKVEGGSAIKQMLEKKMSPPAVITELYLRCYGRVPTPQEVQHLQGLIAENGKDPQQVRSGLEDVFWAILNSKEFLFNH